jgi:hypothetical protein
MYEDHEVIDDGAANNEQRSKHSADVLEVLAVVVAAITLTGIFYAIARAVPLSWFG